MVSKFALVSNLLLASVALAVPSSRLEDRLARRREGRQSPPLDHVETRAAGVSSSDWADVVLEEGFGTFTTVTGTFTVPTPASSNDVASAWVGIDGDTCVTASLQTGVDPTTSGGRVSYDAWYEWYPDFALDFTGICISAGDVITTTVTAYSTTSGVAVIENLTTGQTVTQNLNPSAALCEANAEWIVEDFELGGPIVPFPGFGTVTFTNATASGPDGTYTPSEVSSSSSRTSSSPSAERPSPSAKGPSPPSTSKQATSRRSLFVGKTDELGSSTPNGIVMAFLGMYHLWRKLARR